MIVPGLRKNQFIAEDLTAGEKGGYDKAQIDRRKHLFVGTPVRQHLDLSARASGVPKPEAQGSAPDGRPYALISIITLEYLSLPVLLS